MKLVEVTQQKDWDRAVSSVPHASFTQSWDWGEFRVSLGQPVHRLALEHGGRHIAAGQIIHYPKRFFGGYWYAPRGPVIANDHASEASEILREFTRLIRLQGYAERGFFLRIEPPLSTAVLPLLPEGFVRAQAYMPASTLVVDLMKSEDALLSAMHEKTRYNIRLASKKGVTVREGSERDLDVFLRLHEETAARDQFRPLSSEYLRETFRFLHPRGMAHLRLAECGGHTLAASMEIRYADTVTYLHGASSSSQRNIMAPYALHWEAIRAARASGILFYDFHGINPSDAASPYYKTAWEGITRFKLGFGGERVEYTGTWELPRRPFAYRILRILSRTHL